MEIKVNTIKAQPLPYHQMMKGRVYRGSDSILKENYYLRTDNAKVVNLATGTLCSENSFEDDDMFVEVKCLLTVEGDVA